MAVRKITYQIDNGDEIESGLSVQNAFSALSSGSHTVTKRLYDENNNVIDSDSKSFTVPEPDLQFYMVSEYSMTEQSGDMIDIVNGYNGIINGSVGRDGTRYDFNGDNAYVDVPDNDNFSFVEDGDLPFEIEMDITFDDLTGTFQRIFGRKSSNGYEYQLFLDGDARLAWFQYENGGNNRIETRVDNDVMQEGVEYNLKIVYDGSNNVNGISIEIDGVKENTINSGMGTYSGMANTTSKTVIGRDGDSASLYFNGKIRNLKIRRGESV